MSSAAPTEKDAMFFFHVLLHLKGPKTPDTDWDAVAAAMGLKNTVTAKTRFGQIKKKFEGASGDTPAKATPAKAATPSKRKKAAPKKKSPSEIDAEDSLDEQPQTPSKKPKIKAEPKEETPEPEFGEES